MQILCVQILGIIVGLDDEDEDDEVPGREIA